MYVKFVCGASWDRDSQALAQLLFNTNLAAIFYYKLARNLNS